MSNKEFDEILRKQLLEEEVPYSEKEWELFESHRKRTVFKNRFLSFFRRVFYVLLIAAFTSVLTLFIAKKYYGNHNISINENGIVKEEQQLNSEKNTVNTPGTSTPENKKNGNQTFRQKNISENVIGKNSTSIAGEESSAKKVQSKKANNSFIQIKEKKLERYKNQERTTQHVTKTIEVSTNDGTNKIKRSIKQHEQIAKVEVANKPLITEQLIETKETSKNETENNGNIVSKISDSAKAQVELVSRIDKPEINQQTVIIDNSEKTNLIPETIVSTVRGDSLKSNTQNNIAGKVDSVSNKSHSQKKHAYKIERMKPFYLFASANIDDPIPNSIATSSSNLGYAFGAGYRYYYKNNWSLAGEIFYSKKNGDAIIASNDYTQFFLEKETTTRMLTIRSSEWLTTAIHFIYNTNNNRHSVFIGSTFSYLLSTRGTIEERVDGKFQKLTDAPNYISGMQPYSIGAVLGCSYALTENFILRASYSKGFTDITSYEEISKSLDYLNGVGITLIMGIK